MANLPLLFRYSDDETFVPVGRSKEECAKRFAIGEHVRFVEVEERSTASHNHEFAFLAEAWRNLPENLAALYPTPEHLRKRALVEGGYFTEDIVDAGSHAAALRVAAFARTLDEFAVITVHRAMVSIKRAKSQSRRSMDRQEFQASKESILQIVSAMIGTTPAELQANAGRAA